MNTFKNMIMEFAKEEDGFGVVEIILIIVVLIGLVIIFRDGITNIVDSIFEKITEGVDEV